MDIKEILDKAEKAALEAGDRFASKYPGFHGPCGFAYVIVKPARGKLIAELRERDLGWHDSGYWVSMGRFTHSQCLNLKEIMAEAYAGELTREGIKCSVHTRLD